MADKLPPHTKLPPYVLGMHASELNSAVAAYAEAYALVAVQAEREAIIARLTARMKHQGTIGRQLAVQDCIDAIRVRGAQEGGSNG